MLSQLSYIPENGAGGRNRTSIIGFGDRGNATIRHRLKWSGMLDSNQRPLAPKASALPGCANPRAGVVGFEPTSFSVNSRVRSPRLLYANKLIRKHTKEDSPLNRRQKPPNKVCFIISARLSLT
jgi:hypothetical protein